MIKVTNIVFENDNRNKHLCCLLAFCYQSEKSRGALGTQEVEAEIFTQVSNCNELIFMIVISQFLKQVSHHPTLIACHCEGRGWKFWADSNLKSKFWGRSIQLDPVGTLTLEFDDGEIFQWSKVGRTSC